MKESYNEKRTSFNQNEPKNDLTKGRDKEPFFSLSPFSTADCHYGIFGDVLGVNCNTDNKSYIFE